MRIALPLPPNLVELLIGEEPVELEITINTLPHSPVGLVTRKISGKFIIPYGPGDEGVEYLVPEGDVMIDDISMNKSVTDRLVPLQEKPSWWEIRAYRVSGQINPETVYAGTSAPAGLYKEQVEEIEASLARGESLRYSRIELVCNDTVFKARDFV